MNVFFSWSGDDSRDIAALFRDWLPSVLQAVQPFFTPEIEKGVRWGTVITEQLENSNVGLLFLTNDNLQKPWILFEAGALSKSQNTARVCGICFGIKTTDVSPPLSQFQLTEFTYPEMLKLMQTLNGELGETGLPVERLNRSFDKWWPDLEDSVQKILQRDKPAIRQKGRAPDEMLEELLQLVRSLEIEVKSTNVASNAPLSSAQHLEILQKRLSVALMRLNEQLSRIYSDVIPTGLRWTATGKLDGTFSVFMPDGYDVNPLKQNRLKIERLLTNIIGYEANLDIVAYRELPTE